MKTLTQTVAGVLLTSVVLGTAAPIPLTISALAANLPDCDTSKSLPGRILYPLARFLEERFPHRSLTHSFVATAAICLLSLPLVWINPGYWGAVTIGFFAGWFCDVFTKQGVAAFYPWTMARCVIPGNPRLRLTTGSPAEYVVLGVLLAGAIASIHMHTNGGLLHQFNQVMALPSGAVEQVSAEQHRYLLTAHIKGRDTLTQQPIEGDFEVVQPLTATDLLVLDRQGQTLRAGTTNESNILVSRIQIKRGPAIKQQVETVTFENEAIGDVMTRLNGNRVYVTGTIILEDAEGLSIPMTAGKYDAIRYQPGDGVKSVQVEAATPGAIAKVLGDYYGSGTLAVRKLQ